MKNKMYFFIYIGVTGTTSVAFSLGRVLFNTSTVELVSLIVVIGRSDVVGVCACIELVIDPMGKGIVAITIIMTNRL